MLSAHRREKAEAGHVLARAARRSQLRRAADDGDHEPHLRPAAPAAGPRGPWSSCAGCVPMRARPRLAVLGVGCACWRCSDTLGWWLALLAAAPCCWLAGAVAAARHDGRQVGAGRPDPAGEHPLWSSFVWRNELADTFVEMVAAPWFARVAAGHRRC